MYSPAALETFADVKRVFDPLSLLNPGVVVRPKAVDADLRLVSVRPVRDRLGFGYGADGGDFAAAVHRCTGVGKCRVTAGAGMMCPSFRATRDEKDSTRGRARVLQELVVGGWADGEGRREGTLGALLLGYHDDEGCLRYAGRVGTGFNDAELDRLREAGRVPAAASDPGPVLAALRQHDPRVLAEALANDLQPAAISLRPALRRTLRAGTEEGALAGIVSGSGPTCVFLAADAEHAKKIATGLAGQGVARAVRVVRGPVPGARIV